MKKFQILDGTTLKIIAIISMIIDHIGYSLYPEYQIFRIIGRIAFPIFAFLVAEGYIHTSNKRNYLLRIGVFALISEVPFNLLVSWNYFDVNNQNVLFTFFISILSLMIYEHFTTNKDTISYILGLLSITFFAYTAYYFKTDYGAYGVVLVFIYYLFRKNDLCRNIIATIYQLCLKHSSFYIYSFLSFIPIFLYNGKRGKDIKYLFYAIYPIHMLIIYYISLCYLET